MWPQPGFRPIAFRHKVALLLPGPPMTQIIGGIVGSSPACTLVDVRLSLGCFVTLTPLLLSEPMAPVRMVAAAVAALAAICVLTAFVTERSLALATWSAMWGAWTWLGAVSTLTILPGISCIPLPIPVIPLSMASWFSSALSMSSTAVRKSLYTSVGARSPLTCQINSNSLIQ